jgi:hypothetical protein
MHFFFSFLCVLEKKEEEIIIAPAREIDLASMCEVHPRMGDTFLVECETGFEGANSQPQQQQQQLFKKNGVEISSKCLSPSLSFVPCSHVYSFEYAVIRFFMALNVSLSRLFSVLFFLFFVACLCVTPSGQEIERPWPLLLPNSLAHFFAAIFIDNKKRRGKNSKRLHERKRKKNVVPLLLLLSCSCIKRNLTLKKKKTNKKSLKLGIFFFVPPFFITYFQFLSLLPKR